MDIVSLGLALILAGFGIVVATLLTSTKSSSAKWGGVIMLGPIPVTIASDTKWASIAVALAIALMLIVLLFYVF